MYPTFGDYRKRLMEVLDIIKNSRHTRLIGSSKYSYRNSPWGIGDY